jgi:hypothetical protein
MHELAGGEIILWAENGGPIMLKVLQPHGDPVELADHEAQELVDCLVRLINNNQVGS